MERNAGETGQRKAISRVRPFCFCEKKRFCRTEMRAAETVECRRASCDWGDCKTNIFCERRAGFERWRKVGRCGCPAFKNVNEFPCVSGTGSVKLFSERWGLWLRTRKSAARQDVMVGLNKAVPSARACTLITLKTNEPLMFLSLQRKANSRILDRNPDTLKTAAGLADAQQSRPQKARPCALNPLENE